MKKLILTLVLLIFGASAHAQTAADVLAAANAGVCDKYAQATGCTDAQVLAAFCTATTGSASCPDTRAAEDKIYATAGAYATAVLLPPKQAEVFRARRNAVVEKLVRLIVSDPTKCAAVMTAASLDTSVCK